MDRGLLTKLKHYLPATVLRHLYFGVVHSYLQYGVTSWGNAASKYTQKIQVHQNYISKIIKKKLLYSKQSFYKIYSDLNLLKPNNIFNREVLKFVIKF